MLKNPHGVIQYIVTCDGPQPVGHMRAGQTTITTAKKQIALVHTVAQIFPIDVESALRGDNLSLPRTHGTLQRDICALYVS